jgi:hypothetical protein
MGRYQPVCFWPAWRAPLGLVLGWEAVVVTSLDILSRLAVHLHPIRLLMVRQE